MVLRQRIVSRKWIKSFLLYVLCVYVIISVKHGLLLDISSQTFDSGQPPSDDVFIRQRRTLFVHNNDAGANITKTDSPISTVSDLKSNNISILTGTAGKQGDKNETIKAIKQATGNLSTTPPVAVANNRRAVQLQALHGLPAITEDEFYRKQPNVVNDFMYGYSLLPKNRCTSDVMMLFVIHSKPDYFERRMAIRKTWASVDNSSHVIWGNETLPVKVVVNFVVAMTSNVNTNSDIELENQRYGDIIRGDFMDSYQNMTLKSLLDLTYAAEFCSEVPFLVKSDDDMLIKIPYLARVLRNDTFKRSIMGPHNGRSRVYRRGKWGLTREEFPFDYYPPYESGAAYMITMDIVQELLDTAKYVPWIFIDDVYITGILAKIINATHVKGKGGFAYWTDKTPTHCDIVLETMITMTKATPNVLETIWKQVKVEYDDHVKEECKVKKETLAKRAAEESKKALARRKSAKKQVKPEPKPVKPVQKPEKPPPQKPPEKRTNAKPVASGSGKNAQRVSNLELMRQRRLSNRQAMKSRKKA